MARKFVTTAKHLGGLEGIKEGRTVALVISDDGVAFKEGFKGAATIPWDRVRAMDIDGSDEVQRRVTATRLLTVGIFAFAAKKKIPNVAYLVLGLDAGEAVLEISKTKPIELRGKLAPYQARVSAPAP